MTKLAKNKKPIRLRVRFDYTPTPDHDERLKKVFMLLLRPLDKGKGEIYDGSKDGG